VYGICDVECDVRSMCALPNMAIGVGVDDDDDGGIIIIII
jgi:hypothetical protein